MRRFLERTGWVVLVAVLGIGWLNSKLARLDEQTVPAGVVPVGFSARDVRLAPDDAAKVVLRPGKVATVRPENTKTAYVPEGAPVVVTVKKDGRVDVKAKQFGLTFAPGLGLAVGAGRPCGVLDLRFAYYKRFSGVAGVTLQRAPQLYLGLGYNVLSRTHVWLGKTKDGVLGGVRVSW